MNFWKKLTVNEYGIWFLTLSIIVQRLSVAVGNGLFCIAIACLLLDLYKTRGAAVKNLQKKYWLPFVIFAICVLPSVIFSPFHSISIKWFFNNAVYRPLAFFIIMLLTKDTEILNKTFKWIVLCFNLECLLSIGYAFTGYDNRAAGLGGSSLAFASCICMFLAIYIVQAFEADFAIKNRVYAMINILISGLAVIATGSRGGWVTFAIILFVMSMRYVLTDWRKAVGLILFVGMIGSAVCLNNWMYNRLVSIGNANESSRVARIVIYQRGIEMWQDHPIKGIGAGSWKKIYPTQYYKIQDNVFPLPHAHNNVIHMAAETGALGFIGYIVLMGTFFFDNLIKLWKKFNPYRFIIVGIILSFNCYGLIEYNFGLTFVMRTFWYFMAGLSLLADKKDEEISG